MSYGSALSGKTLEDLYSAILADPALPMAEKVQTINELRAQLPYPASTTLQSAMPKLVGLGIGALIARYFGFGIMGTLAFSGAGYGLGSAIWGAISRPRGKLRETEAFNFKGASNMTSTLHPTERTTAIKLGALIALRLCGVIPDHAVKTGNAGVVGLGAVLGLGALFGAGAHAADRLSSPDNVSERERLKRIQYLLEAGDRARDELRMQQAIEGNLAGRRRG